MSFEGYYQIVCRNGHEHSCDCYDEPVFDANPADYVVGPYSENVWSCPTCGAPATWWNLVNETNGSYCDECNIEGEEDVTGCRWCVGGRIDGFVKLVIDKPTGHCTCKECGVTHVSSEGTVLIPEKGGHKVNI